MSEQKEIIKPAIEKPAGLHPVTPEVQVEKGALENNKSTTEKAEEFLVTPTTSGSSLTPPATPEVERQVEIERILEDDLATVYFNLPEDKKEKFRLQGEQAAYQINTLLSSAKINIQKIIKVIKNWLLLIPGVNHFFLEQEAKLKADEIIKLNDKF